MSIREYYCLRLHQRNIEVKTILLGGRLLHQFIVDAYASIEYNRLSWLHRNQRTLRSYLDRGLQDVITEVIMMHLW